MRLYSVSDGYIEYLHSEHPHVYSNKENKRTHTRKYLGIVLEVNDYNYFVPLSSPKNSDYSDGKVKKDSFLIFRIVSGEEIRGSIRIANMIPVPSNELELYHVEEETDRKYKDLVQEELEYIRKNSERIIKRAKLVYKKKTSGSNESIMDLCLDYNSLEHMHDVWIENVTNGYNSH